MIGYESVRLMKALVEDDQQTVKEMFPERGKDPDGDIYGTGLKIVVPDKGSPLKQDLFDASTEFLTLSAFKDWLATYKLKGS
jgi:ribose transport system substrate-binding protein